MVRAVIRKPFTNVVLAPMLGKIERREPPTRPFARISPSNPVSPPECRATCDRRPAFRSELMRRALDIHFMS